MEWDVRLPIVCPDVQAPSLWFAATRQQCFEDSAQEIVGFGVSSY